jgi:signal transduction histidine kinase
MRRLSIPTRIFLGFALLLVAFGGVSVVSVVQHEQTASRLLLLHEGYLPLALTVGEAKATQAVFGTLLDRVMSERDPTATRNWLNAARQVRPATLRRALYGVGRAEELARGEADVAALTEVRTTLEEVGVAYEEGDARYDELFDALVSHEDERAERLLRSLRAEERNVQTLLRDARAVLQERIAIVSAEAEEQQRRASVLLGALTIVGLLLGGAVIFAAHRMLSPLPRLMERVGAVARGDLSAKLEPRTDDELGRLAAEFERMVEALAARDQRLREAAAEELRTKARLIQTERLAAIGRMAAHVTHEVRNPLSSIGLNVEMLEEELASAGPEPRALLRAIQREIDRLTATTEEYLRLARLPQPRLETEDVGTIVRSVATFVEREMKETGVALETRIAADLPPVALDEQQFRQALLNLLRNAREASPPGGRIHLEADPGETGVVVRVRDEGPGIPELARERMFDLFYTTKEHGSGLGLPLTQQIVVAHGGHIRCESAEGRGTTFELVLPAATEPTTDVPETPAVALAAGTTEPS